MPNTLGHMGVHALVTRGVMRRADPGWIWLGCILPDLPWILQRVLRASPLEVSAYDLRLYAAVQSSLALCLLGAAAAASLARAPGRAFAIVALGCALHLGLDALQTKWANGVLLFAPLDWTMLNLGLFWPEELPSHLLTGLGLAVALAFSLRASPAPIEPPPLASTRTALGAVLAAAYLALPLALMPSARAADLHFVATLEDTAVRAGKPVEFDRSRIAAPGSVPPVLAPWTGDLLPITGMAPGPEAASVSVRGRFGPDGGLVAESVHVHPPQQRDLFSYAGLLFAAVWWARGWAAGRRARARAPAAP